MKPLADLPLWRFSEGDKRAAFRAPIVPDDPPKYPEAPGFRGPHGGPSHMAAKEVATTCTALRGEVAEYLEGMEAKFGPAFGGLTVDQISDGLKRHPRSIQPRLTELFKTGKVEKGPVNGISALGSPATRWRLSRPGGT